jgi:hypothetical protein
MEIVVKNNYTPLHDFEFSIKGLSTYAFAAYSTREYPVHLYFSKFDTISNIAPLFGRGFPDSVGIINGLSFIWEANKLLSHDYVDFEPMNVSGPHKIYLTYDQPKLDTVNTLALDKICSYAQDQSIDTAIVHKGVTGVYAEKWRYRPEHPIFSDPLDVIRETIGQCADYANLLTTLYSSVGIKSNSTVIYNGIDSSSLIILPLWTFTEPVDTPLVVMLTKKLTSCDDTTKKWQFTYHAVCGYDHYYCDGALGLFKLKADYEAWWLYYLHPRSLNPPYRNIEPPNIPPCYYNWPFLIPTDNVLPHLAIFRDFHFRHP